MVFHISLAAQVVTVKNASGFTVVFLTFDQMKNLTRAKVARQMSKRTPQEKEEVWEQALAARTVLREEGVVE